MCAAPDLTGLPRLAACPKAIRHFGPGARGAELRLYQRVLADQLRAEARRCPPPPPMLELGDVVWLALAVAIILYTAVTLAKLAAHLLS